MKSQFKQIRIAIAALLFTIPNFAFSGEAIQLTLSKISSVQVQQGNSLIPEDYFLLVGKDSVTGRSVDVYVRLSLIDSDRKTKECLEILKAQAFSAKALKGYLVGSGTLQSAYTSYKAYDLQTLSSCGVVSP